MPALQVLTNFRVITQSVVQDTGVPATFATVVNAPRNSVILNVVATPQGATDGSVLTGSPYSTPNTASTQWVVQVNVSYASSSATPPEVVGTLYVLLADVVNL